MNDITPFVNWFLSTMVNLFTFVFNTLDSISFMGITLLDFVLTVFILSVAVPLVITTMRASSYEKRIRHAEGLHNIGAAAERKLESSAHSGVGHKGEGGWT